MIFHGIIRVKKNLCFEKIGFDFHYYPLRTLYIYIYSGMVSSTHGLTVTCNREENRTGVFQVKVKPNFSKT
jgi:hypothetical protein